MQCDLSFIRNNAMWNDVLRVVPFKIYFLICFWSDHRKILMVNANINALFAGSLRIKIWYFISEKSPFYRWCVTKVAHCIVRIAFANIKDSIIEQRTIKQAFATAQSRQCHYCLHYPANALRENTAVSTSMRYSKCQMGHNTGILMNTFMPIKSCI